MSDAVNDWLDAAQARCDAATGGPWAVDRYTIYTYVENDECRGCSGLVSPAHEPSCGFREVAASVADDADFIVHARTHLPKALAALRIVLAQHHLHDCSPEHGSWCSPCWSEGLCEGCSEDWPCPTVKVIAEALEVTL